MLDWLKHSFSINEFKVSLLMIALVSCIGFSIYGYMTKGDIPANFLGLTQSLVYAVAGVNAVQGIGSMMGGSMYGGYNNYGGYGNTYGGMNTMNTMPTASTTSTTTTTTTPSTDTTVASRPKEDDSGITKNP